MHSSTLSPLHIARKVSHFEKEERNDMKYFPLVSQKIQKKEKQDDLST